MFIKFVIFVLLVEKFCYGYEIKNEFDWCINYIWFLNIGQVYIMLDCFECDGLCYCGEEIFDGRVIVIISLKGCEEVC